MLQACRQRVSNERFEPQKKFWGSLLSYGFINFLSEFGGIIKHMKVAGALSILFLLSAVSVNAESNSVHISNNGGSSSVKIDNNVNSSSNSTVNSHTRVEVSNNGETKVFESNGGDINYQSPDGKTSVQVHNNGGTNIQSEQKSETKTEVNSSVSGQKKDDEKNAHAQEKKSSEKVEKEADLSPGFFEIIFERIASFFNNLFS